MSPPKGVPERAHSGIGDLARYSFVLPNGYSRPAALAGAGAQGVWVAAANRDGTALFLEDPTHGISRRYPASCPGVRRNQRGGVRGLDGTWRELPRPGDAMAAVGNDVGYLADGRPLAAVQDWGHDNSALLLATSRGFDRSAPSPVRPR